MFGYTWAQTIPYISLIVSILAFLFAVSKFFIELYDRNERIKKEKIAKKKAEFHVSTNLPYLLIENKGGSDAFVKEILLDGNTWEESDLFIDDKPTYFKAGQPTRSFKMSAYVDNPFPRDIVIQYVDTYSKENNLPMYEEPFEV